VNRREGGGELTSRKKEGEGGHSFNREKGEREGSSPHFSILHSQEKRRRLVGKKEGGEEPGRLPTPGPYLLYAQKEKKKKEKGNWFPADVSPIRGEGRRKKKKEFFQCLRKGGAEFCRWTLAMTYDRGEEKKRKERASFPPSSSNGERKKKGKKGKPSEKKGGRGGRHVAGRRLGKERERETAHSI